MACNALPQNSAEMREAHLDAVNARRQALALPKIDKLTADTKLDAGLVEADKTPAFNKQSVLRDLKAISDATGAIQDLGKEEAASILSGLATLEADPALLDALQRRSLIEKALILSMARLPALRPFVGERRAPS